MEERSSGEDLEAGEDVEGPGQEGLSPSGEDDGDAGGAGAGPGPGADHTAAPVRTERSEANTVAGPGTKCPCSRCNYECCLLARQQRQHVDVDALAMELRMFVASQERMARDVRRYREQRVEAATHDGAGGGGGPVSDLTTDQFHAVASCLEELARRAPTESCEHLAGTLGEMMTLRAALGPVVDSVLVSGLHRLRDLRRRTGTPSAPVTPAAAASLSSAASIMPMSAQEHHHAGTGGLSSRARFVTFPSEAVPESRLAEEWRAILGPRERPGPGAAPRPRPYASECLRVRPAFSSECLRPPPPVHAAVTARPQRAHSDPDVASTAASSRTLSMEAERSGVFAARRPSAVQRSRSRSRVTLASLSLSLAGTGAGVTATSLGSRPSVDSGLAQSGFSGTSYPPSGGAGTGSGQAAPAATVDDSGDLVRAADEDKSVSMEDHELFGLDDFKEDRGMCSFFGGRVPSGDRGSAVQRLPSVEAAAVSDAGLMLRLGDVDAAWEQPAADVDAPGSPPEALSFGDEDEDLKALRDEIKRGAAGAAAPTTELYTAQVAPQKSEVNLFDAVPSEERAGVSGDEGFDGGPGDDRGGDEGKVWKEEDDDEGVSMSGGPPLPLLDSATPPEKEAAAAAAAGTQADESPDAEVEARRELESREGPAAASQQEPPRRAAEETQPTATTQPEQPPAPPAATAAPPGQGHDRVVVPSTSQPSLVAAKSSAREVAAPVRDQDQDQGRVAATASRASGVGSALVRIASSPFQIARALLGPAVHFRPPSKDVIPRCHQNQPPAPASPSSPSGPSLDFLRTALHWPDLGFVFGRTIHQAAADSIREMAQHDLDAHREGRHRVPGRSCSVISNVPPVPEQPSDEEDA